MKSKLVSLLGLVLVPAALGISIGLGRLRHEVHVAAAEVASSAPTAVNPFLECVECDHAYAPYCAEDGLIYQNLCVLKCQGAVPLHEGLCDPCDCQFYSEPVCTRSGSLYANRCEAQCHDAEVFAAGAACADLERSPTVPSTPLALVSETEVPQTDVIEEPVETTPELINPDICAENYDPVCGSDGQTYSNACFAEYYQATVVVDDECYGLLKNPADCNCENDFAPVCGLGSKTYRNACYANCAQVLIIKPYDCSRTVPPKRRPCICPANYAPVCGVDGVTYSNKCTAGCAKAEVAYEGQCDGRTVSP